MEIKGVNLDFSVGDYPAGVHIASFDATYGIGVAVHLFTSEEEQVVQFRKKGNEVALFSTKFEEIELPEWWQDSKLIWEWKSKT